MIGIIGGSGLYQLEGLTNTHWETVSSPFGQPSDQLLFGKLNNIDIVFLPRHGRKHLISPSEINARANIDVLKRVGVNQIISVSAVGSLREELKPGTFVLVDQFIDRTVKRDKTFFSKGCVAHVSLAHPVCNRLIQCIYDVSKNTDINITLGGTYIAIEGPQFSTLAESNLYRSWNCDVIGMTNIPEAYLAREAQICYATIAMVTDYDCWHPDHDNVSVEQIVQTLSNNAINAQNLLKKIIVPIATHANKNTCSCHFALDNAIITRKEYRDTNIMKKLDAVMKRNV